MHKVRDNYTAEIIILIVIATMFLTSCGSTYTCPSYASTKKYEFEALLRIYGVSNTLLSKVMVVNYATSKKFLADPTRVRFIHLRSIS